MSTARRKKEHLRLVIEKEVGHDRGPLLDEVQLVHQALPELDLDEVNTEVEMLGKRLRLPLMICSMTGGGEVTQRLNHELAQIAEELGLAFAVGSQRVMLEKPQVLSDFAVRSSMPHGVLLGNIGAVQLPQYPVEQIADLMEQVEADGLCVHLNPAQELIQPEGDRRFRHLLEGITRLAERLPGRVLVKETGAGLSPETVHLLKRIGINHVDVAGAGGTSWTKVEMYRLPGGTAQKTGQVFANWGLPTAFCIIAARRILGESAFIVGSGGLWTGLDCVRALAIGSSIAGLARPILLAWHRGGMDEAHRFITQLAQEIRLGMLLTGCQDVRALRRAPRIYTGQLSQWLAAYDIVA